LQFEGIRTVARRRHGRRKDFFQGVPLGHFSKIFQRGAQKWWICFFSLEIKKPTFFCWNFKDPEAHGCRYHYVL